MKVKTIPEITLTFKGLTPLQAGVLRGLLSDSPMYSERAIAQVDTIGSIRKSLPGSLSQYLDILME